MRLCGKLHSRSFSRFTKVRRFGWYLGMPKWSLLVPNDGTAAKIGELNGRKCAGMWPQSKVVMTEICWSILHICWSTDWVPNNTPKTKLLVQWKFFFAIPDLACTSTKPPTKPERKVALISLEKMRLQNQKLIFQIHCWDFHHPRPHPSPSSSSSSTVIKNIYCLIHGVQWIFRMLNRAEKWVAIGAAALLNRWCAANHHRRASWRTHGTGGNVEPLGSGKHPPNLPSWSIYFKYVILGFAGFGYSDIDILDSYFIYRYFRFGKIDM